MKTNWYHSDGRQTFGPFPEEQIVALIQSGQLTCDHFVVPEGSEDWQPVSASPFANYAPQPAAPASAPQAQVRVPKVVHAARKPIAVQAHTIPPTTVEMTCPICTGGIVMTPAALKALQGTAEFDCPTCGGPVPVPGVNTPIRVKAPSVPVASAPAPRVVATVPARTDGVAASPLRTFQGLNRNVVILGTLTLLTLGGLGMYLAMRKGPTVTKVAKNVRNEAVRNKFIKDLIASGATTAKELKSITEIRPLGIGFSGVSREKHTWEQALALATRTGARIMAIEPPRNAAREPVLTQLAENYPALRGTTVWATENGQPRVIDGPNINPVTTLDRPRLVFVHWVPLSSVQESKTVAAKIDIPPPPVKVPPSNKPLDVELASIKAPAELSPAKEIRLRVKPGEKFKIELTAWYRTPEPSKLASNLLIEEAKILPPDFLQELRANHNTTWHFDSETRPGYKSVNGEGEITFDLTAYTPKAKGEYTFNLNLGLFDKVTWNTKVLKSYKVTLIADGQASFPLSK